MVSESGGMSSKPTLIYRLSIHEVEEEQHTLMLSGLYLDSGLCLGPPLGSGRQDHNMLTVAGVPDQQRCLVLGIKGHSEMFSLGPCSIHRSLVADSTSLCHTRRWSRGWLTTALSGNRPLKCHHTGKNPCFRWQKTTRSRRKLVSGNITTVHRLLTAFKLPGILRLPTILRHLPPSGFLPSSVTTKRLLAQQHIPPEALVFDKVRAILNRNQQASGTTGSRWIRVQ